MRRSLSLALASVLLPAGMANAQDDQHPLLARLRARAAEHPLVVAHRGASAACPENTLPAFRRALDDEADLVELDFFATRDGVLVCFHDPTLERTTNAAEVLGNGKLNVRDVDYEDMLRLDAGRWKHASFAGTPVPTLREALTTIQPRSITMVEHKEGPAATLVQLLADLDMTRDVLVQSFDWTWLAELHRLEPRILKAALGPEDGVPSPGSGAFFPALEKTGASIVHWSARRLRLEDCRAIRGRGLMTCAYTLNDDVSLAGAPAVGLQMITTDRPDRLRELILGLGLRTRDFE